jgi:hypothetical protein
MQTSKLINLMAQSVLLFALISVAAGKIIYVDDDANGINDGTSWENAYKFIQDALADANSAEKPVEIRVAQGIYRPDRSSTEPNGTGDRTATFQLINGVNLKGGYAGFGETDPNARDIDKYRTILSGDLDGNDIDVNDPALLLWEPSRAENSYHVVTGSGNDETAVFDGFIVTAGNADGPWQQPYHRGGGMLNDSGSPTIANCTFRGNAAEEGGGMNNGWVCSPTLTNCTFNRNSADWSGGGMSNAEADPTLINCTFSGNSARYAGGGMANSFNRTILINCRFSGNSSIIGGGIDNFNNNLELTNCSFVGNSTNDAGGGISIGHFSILKVTNCTFSGNRAVFGSTIYSYDIWLTLTNCILWDGGDEIWIERSLPMTITYNDVQGGWPGEGNIDTDPCFAEPGYWDQNGTPDDANDDFWVDGDYHLKSQAGRWDVNEGRWTRDEVTSLCIDAGDPKSPIGLEPFPNGGIINMGAYGGTTEASKSYFGAHVCETVIAGDINGDCKVNFLDFTFMALHWLKER